VPDEIPSEQPLKHDIEYKDGDVVKVYATDTQLLNKLKRINVEMVDNPAQASVLWIREHFHEFK